MLDGNRCAVFRSLDSPGAGEVYWARPALWRAGMVSKAAGVLNYVFPLLCVRRTSCLFEWAGAPGKLAPVRSRRAAATVRGLGRRLGGTILCTFWPGSGTTASQLGPLE